MYSTCMHLIWKLSLSCRVVQHWCLLAIKAIWLSFESYWHMELTTTQQTSRLVCLLPMKQKVVAWSAVLQCTSNVPLSQKLESRLVLQLCRKFMRQNVSKLAILQRGCLLKHSCSRHVSKLMHCVTVIRCANAAEQRMPFSYLDMSQASEASAMPSTCRGGMLSCLLPLKAM